MNTKIEKNIQEKNIYIIILNWNGKKFLEKCINSVLKSTYKVNVVVVDNASSDGSVKYLKKNYPQIAILKNKTNFGWGGGNNSGVEYALKREADAIFILNNDTEIEEKCVTNLVNELFKRREIGIVGPKIYLSVKDKRTRKISFAGGKFTKNRYFGIHVGDKQVDVGQFDSVKETEFTTGAAMMVKSEVFKKVGLFEERFFIYYEEGDFCMSTKKAGYKILFVPDAHVYHAFSGTVKLNSPFQHYYTTRNHYLFVQMNAPLDVKIREFMRTPKTIYEFLSSKDTNKKKYSLLGIRDYYLRKFGKRIYW